MDLSEKAQLETYISVAARGKEKHLSILENAFNDFPLLHISPIGNIKKFVPTVSTKTLKDGEDRTIPRVSTSTHLLGCLNGTGGFYLDTVSGVERNSDWKGGYYIYGFMPELAVKPDSTMLSDTDYNEEFWLLRYSNKTDYYTPVSIGKIFISDWLLVNTSKERLSNPMECNFYIDNSSIVDFKLTPDVIIKGKTCYKVNSQIISTPKDDEYWSFRNFKISIKKIDRAEYGKAKKVSADMLSYKEPLSYKW